MNKGSDWDEFFSRLGREIESRIRDAMEQSLQVFEPMPGGYRRPRADLKATHSHVYIVLEMPGCAKEKIDVQAEDRVITVTAEYMTPSQEFSSIFPFIHGKGYRRTIQIPRPIDPSKIQAKYESGLLFIKAEITQPKGVKIQID